MIQQFKISHYFKDYKISDVATNDEPTIVGIVFINPNTLKTFTKKVPKYKFKEESYPIGATFNVKKRLFSYKIIEQVH